MPIEIDILELNAFLIAKLLHALFTLAFVQFSTFSNDFIAFIACCESCRIFGEYFCDDAVVIQQSHRGLKNATSKITMKPEKHGNSLCGLRIFIVTCDSNVVGALRCGSVSPQIMNNLLMLFEHVVENSTHTHARAWGENKKVEAATAVALILTWHRTRRHDCGLILSYL